MRRVLFAVLAGVLVVGASTAQAKVVITIDKSTQRMSVEVDGEPRWQWAVSTGRSGYSTPGGTYRAFRMEKDHFSKEWDDAPMPHSIFFTQKGHAIHGSYETRKLGTPASAGCVRLAPENAAKLFALVQERGVTNATVVIAGGDPPSGRRAPRRVVPQEHDDAPHYAPPPGYGHPPVYHQPRPMYVPPFGAPPGYYYEQRGPYYRW